MRYYFSWDFIWISGNPSSPYRTLLQSQVLQPTNESADSIDKKELKPHHNNWVGNKKAPSNP
jgi:hypothetical protein